MKTFSVNLTIENEHSLPSLYGDMDKNLRLIENTYGVVLHARGNRIQIEGEEKAVSKVEHLIKQLDRHAGTGYHRPERRRQRRHSGIFLQFIRCLERHFPESDPRLEQKASS